ncbi:anti-sigma B factor antagonist [Rhodovulum bhavnagarense]|uniref:Anti-sigma factor antagonist n=1 Tax=Rhodovulum bhavnagarense TaxID=992286 RepID=A0A4R2RP44_9RHOB|nr:STAS domain-containing protein [Rhodovulum bhavnagarense]TCP61591.1 anti-sigma B factor antagonist [Rhodovulum bhavnagarense]
MELYSETRDKTLVVTVAEARIDSAVAIRFKERMRDLASGGHGRVLLDLSRVGFVDSSGLGAVVAVMKLLAPECRLELCGLTPTVAKVFRLTRMDRVFTIHEDCAAALAAQTTCG